MSIISLVFALLLEQYRPIRSQNSLYLAFVRFANYLERVFHGGDSRHGMIAWIAAIFPVTLVIVAVYFLLSQMAVVFGWLWCILILYLTMGFRQFSHPFNEVAYSLSKEDIGSARTELSKWTAQDASQMSSAEVACVAIEEGTEEALRYVFAPIFWFMIFAPVLGPAGIIIYRMNTLLYQKWSNRPNLIAFGDFVTKIQYYLDWLPARLMAISFAIVGDFEDAIYCWRTQAAKWPDRIQGVLLAAAGGALGVCLGSVITQDHQVKVRPEIGLGEPASSEALQRAVGLIWRTVLLWISTLGILSFLLWMV